jgi:hypothetical protein
MSSSSKTFGQRKEMPPVMQFGSCIRLAVVAPREGASHASRDRKSIMKTRQNSGACTRGIRWAIGIEVAAGICVYGLWHLLHI